MATGDFVVFDEAKAYMIDGGWAAADVIWLAVCDNTTSCAAADPIPAVGSGGTTNYTEVGAAGTYVTGGLNLGALSAVVTQAAGVMTFDSATALTWAQDASNDTDAYWGVVYNTTDAANRAIGFFDLGGPVNMATGALTITPAAGGYFTIT